MKKPIIAFSLLMAIVCACLTTFAAVAPPSAECPDKCKTAEPVCCTTPGGSTYFGTLSN